MHKVTHTNYDFMMGRTHLASADNPMASKEKVRTFYYDNASRPENSVIVVTLRELQDAFLQKPESLQIIPAIPSARFLTVSQCKCLERR